MLDKGRFQKGTHLSGLISIVCIKKSYPLFSAFCCGSFSELLQDFIELGKIITDGGGTKVVGFFFFLFAVFAYGEENLQLNTPIKKKKKIIHLS